MTRMMQAWRDARLDRLIERELLDGLPRRARARLHDRLRRDARARARYDRAVEALRVLEGDVDVAPFELSLVERWLADDGDAPEPARARVLGGWPTLAAVLTAVLVVLWAGPLGNPGTLRRLADDDGWQARGGGAAQGLALEALCAPDRADAAAVRVRVRDCRLTELMGLAARVPEGRRGQLTLFGVDAQGDPMFYVPTPVAPAGATVTPGRFRALPLAVRLRVNHAPGPLRIYGVLAPRVATVDEVRAFAAALASQPAAAPGDAPWTARVPADAVAPLCPEPSACTAAELALLVRP